jgi:hypothetical protein
MDVQSRAVNVARQGDASIRSSVQAFGGEGIVTSDRLV